MCAISIGQDSLFAAAAAATAAAATTTADVNLSGDTCIKIELERRGESERIEMKPI